MPEPYFALVGPYPRSFTGQVRSREEWDYNMDVAAEMDEIDRSNTQVYYFENPLPQSSDTLQRNATAKRTKERPHKKKVCQQCFQHRSLGGGCFCTDSDLDRSSR